MELEKLLAELEKAAADTSKPANQPEDKPAVSKEIEALLTKEAAATNVTKAFEEGEKLAAAILEKIASDAIQAAQPKTEPTETKEQSAAAPAATADAGTEKTAEAKPTEAKPDDRKAAPEAKEVEKTAEAKAEAKPEETKETTNEENMNKSAQDAGKELATAIIEKLAAQENDAPTGPGKIKADHDKMVAFDNKKVQRNPRNATVSGMFDQLVARAKSVSGATGYDQMATGPSDPHDSKDQAMGTPHVAPSPDVVEKHAAVGALIEAGMDWETAVDLVKSAAEEIAMEEFSTVKMAAVTHLVTEEGFDFDSAVEAVNAAVSEVADEQGKQ